jgi:hypothetical protein
MSKPSILRAPYQKFCQEVSDDYDSDDYDSDDSNSYFVKDRNPFYKKAVCKYYVHGECKFGPRCSFAHSEMELELYRNK